MSNTKNLANLASALDDGTSGQVLQSTGSGGVQFADASSGSGVTVYTGLSGTDGTPSGATYLLNASSPSAGDLAYVTANTSLYQNNGNGWYRIAVINTTPTISSVADASSNTTPFTLEGGTNTVITVTASDADEGTDLTYSYSVTSGSLNGTTVTQGTGVNENVFTIAPHASNATTFSLTFTVSDSINAATSVAAFTLEFNIVDSHYTTLLMATDGSAGDNNDDIADATGNHTSNITVSDNPSAGTFSPYRHGGYSTYFDGTGDYFSISSSSDFNIGADATFECWCYPTATASASPGDLLLLVYGGSNNTAWLSYTGASKFEFRLGYTGTWAQTLTSTNTFGLNQWYHVVGVRSNGTSYLFVNGAQEASGSNSTDLSALGNSVYVGSQGTGRQFQGYISDARIVNGTAVYSGNFTPPTGRLTTTGGAYSSTTNVNTSITASHTKLLTCHLPYISDGSSSDHSITVNGDPSTKPIGPYDYEAYSEGTNGGSIEFDGSNDAVEIADHGDFDLSGGNWTFECWWYPRTLATYDSPFNVGWASGTAASGRQVAIQWESDKLYLFGYPSGSFTSAVYHDATADQLTNKWNHLAAVFNGSTTDLYLNGKASGRAYSSSTNWGRDVSESPKLAKIVRGAGTHYSDCFISDARIVKGTAVYSGNFTPPSGPLTTTGGTYPSTTNVNTSITASNTKLLLKGTDAHVIDKSQVSNLELAGTAAAVTNAPNNSNISSTNAVSFDGDSDYVRVPYESIPSFGAGEFTIEGWIYMNNLSGNQIIVDKYASGNSQSFQIYYRSTGTSLTFYVGSSVLLQDPSSSTISTQTWHHFAVTRDSSGNVRLYVDGLKKAQSTSNVSFDSAINLHLGVQGSTSTNYFNGYMQDVRLSNKAFYTADDHSASSSASIKIPSAPLKG